MSEIFPDKRTTETLDQFYHRFIKPTKQEVKEIKRTVGKAVSFLKREFPHDGYTVKKVLTAGSVGKGTNVHGDADIDLVFFVNGLESVGDLRQKLPDFLSHLMDRAECEEWWDIEARKTTNSSFSCNLDGHKLDILPAFDVCRHYDSNEDVYIAMSNRQKRKDLNMDEIAQEFSASLSPLHLDFIRDLPRQVKKVIRLLKYWKREHQLYIRSCALELLAVHVWRKLGEEDLETTEFIREVMKRLENCGALRIAFNDNYDRSDYRDDFEAPYILDPANPFRNTLRGLDIDDVCEKAKDVLWHL